MTFSPELEARLDKLMHSYPPGRERSALIPMLLYAQDEVGAVTPGVVAEISRRLKITPLQADEVISYYSMLRRSPAGRHHVQVCTNISCLLRGGRELFEHASRRLGIGNKQVTADGRFSLEEVECLGACSWAPAIAIGYDYHHDMTIEKFDRLIDSLERTRENDAV
jgi:NADH-quinone oxidoreductase subunit E